MSSFAQKIKNYQPRTDIPKIKIPENAVAIFKNNLFHEAFDKVYEDPRPDLGQSELWVLLFAEADNISHELFGILHGFRCQGTILEKGKNSYLLRPKISKDDWVCREDYERERDRWLRPHLEQLKEILKFEKYSLVNQT